jgi:soluble lytic murein transglycosylase-like protein
MMKCIFALIALAVATPASADLIFFTNDRTMSVASHRAEGDRLIVKLRGGGEMTFDRALITRIGPDEVAYPDETAAAVPQAHAIPAINGGLVLVGKTSYDRLIESASGKHDVDARIVKAVIQVESSFNPRARSPKGAMGLMQLMPKTARQYEARNPYDPTSNIEAGTKYLSKLLSEFELPLALAAYNAGEAAVRRFGGIPPYAETQAYVAKILSLLGGGSHR